MTRRSPRSHRSRSRSREDYDSYASYLTDPPAPAGSLVKWAFIAAGVGMAFGAGVVLGQGGKSKTAQHPTAPAMGDLSEAKASSEKLDEVRKKSFQFRFHSELKGSKPHPATEAAAAKAEAAPKPAPVKVAAAAPSAPVLPAPKADQKQAVAAKPEREVRAPSREEDALDVDRSDAENKDEHARVMNEVRSGVMEILGNVATWDEGVTPPPLSLRGADAGIAETNSVSGDKAVKAEAQVKVEKPAVKPAPVAHAAQQKPAAKPVAKGGFAVQVASVTSREAAQRVADDLKASGQRVAIVEAEVNGNTVYRVRVPGFGSRDAANAAKAKLGKGFVTAE